MKLRRSVKGRAPQEEWHDTCVHTNAHTLQYAHKHTSSPFFSSLSSMTHPTQGRRVREEEREERRRMGERVWGATPQWREERGGSTLREEDVRGTKRFFFFFNVLTFNFNAMLIRLCVSLLKLFPANMFCHSHRSHVEPRRWFPHRRLFYFCLKTLLFPPLPRLCIAAARLANIRRPQPHAELCSGLPLAALLCSFDGIC